MKMKHLISLLLVAILCLGVLVACSEIPTSKPVFKPTPADYPLVVLDGAPSEYVLVYPEGNNTWKKYANYITSLWAIDGNRMQVVSDTTDPVEKEILLGPTNRPLSQELVTELDKGDDGDHLFGFSSKDKKIAIYATTTEAWSRCTTYLQNAYMTKDGKQVDLVAFPADMWNIQLLTAEQYQAELRAEEEKQKQDAAAVRAAKLEKIKEKILSFDINDFGGSEITLDLGGRWASPPTTPISEHPRLLFTADDLPALRNTFQNSTEYPELVEAYNLLMDYDADEDATNNGELGDRYERSDHSPGNYNYEPRELIIIQAKALAYLLTGDEYYGYDAICSMLNNILTLDIGYFKDDQWRRYGHTMYTAALVYDWCYNLLTPETQMLLISGVEHLVCSGYSSMPDKAHHNGVKMEMGFPPVKEGGTIVGHSSETQFMRDYLSFAIAIFDEVPGWWDMIGGRVYDEYVTPRQYIYAAGMFPEGTAGYSQMRFMTDLRAYWLLEKAVGETPYNADDMKQIVRSYLGHEVLQHVDNVRYGYIFSTGDGGAQKTVETFAGCGFMHAYLFGDDTVMSMVREVYGDTFSYIKYDHTQLSPLEILICLSATDTSNLTENWRDDIPTIQYNDNYYQQMIIMNERNTYDPVNNPVNKTAAVLMKGAGRSSGGHDHESIGNFQIYYKGILTADSGVYDTYGTNHHYYFHEATLGHNSLLIYNPSKPGMSTPEQQKYYSGGQLKLNKTANGDSWMTDDWYVTGKVTGAQYGYEADGKTAKYAYYANDMTKAYHANTVDYVGRTMLVSYTGDETFPMVMFIFDNITADSAQYQKTFLLHCVRRPEISDTNKTVTIDNGAGKLVLTNLKGGDTMNAIGGDNLTYITGANTTVDPTYAGVNDWYNPESSKYDPSTDEAKWGAMWGRVEICPNKGNKNDMMMNVLYVTDSGTTERLVPTLIESDMYIGSTILNQTAIFMKDTKYETDTITFTAPDAAAEADMDYYIGGLAAGKWAVTVGGTSVGTFEVAGNAQTGEGYLLTFTHKGAGTVTVTPVTE